MSSQRRPSSARGRTTRGSLPSDVYWRRRLFVGTVAFSLVFVIAQWLTGGSDGSSDETPAAEQAGAQVSATQTVTAGEATSTAPVTPGAKVTPTLAAPEGICKPADVAVTPSVAKGQAAGGNVTLSLSLQTVTAEACTWQVSSTSVTVRIAKGNEEIWSTRQCARAVPSQSVVVRRAVATIVTMTWNARESNQGCTSRTHWVLPGDFTIAAAALGGEPAEAAFSLGRPANRTVVVTPTPKGTPTPKATPTR
ncbi:hypothetical protein [Nocardioides sp. WS12]|uniref:hypothetical protein n=1 Tax=Nocardioides sp. WS12 TaxID=2486272 RepID=UPI0015FC3477|nr:hypothetical protein [Nocardioides sp. WS12]